MEIHSALCTRPVRCISVQIKHWSILLVDASSYCAYPQEFFVSSRQSPLFGSASMTFIYFLNSNRCLVATSWTTGNPFRTTRVDHPPRSLCSARQTSPTMHAPNARTADIVQGLLRQLGGLLMSWNSPILGSACHPVPSQSRPNLPLGGR